MSINVDLDRLKSFVAVGEELHFTRAAQNRLHVSQPWLSRSVKSLEQKLGVQLFERHSRHVELTPSGTTFALWSPEDHSRFRSDRFGGGAREERQWASNGWLFALC